MSKHFKETDVGSIPVDWADVELGQISSLMTNGFVGTATLHYTDDANGVLYIQGYNIEQNSFNFHGIKKVTNAFHVKHSKSKLKENDLLTVQTGDVGLTAMVPKSLEGSNCHALIITRLKPNKACASYISQYMNSILGRARLSRLEVGSTMMHINVSELSAWKVPIPTDLKEQKAIAKALSDTDALISALEKLIEKKRAIKTATMQQLLTGRTRLPGFGEGKGYKDSELGRIPEDWDVVNLCDIGNTIAGLTYSPADVAGSGVLVLRSSNIQNSSLDYDNCVYVNLDVPQRVMVKENDILICVRNGSKALVGKSALIDGSADGAAFGAFMSVFRSYLPIYALYQFQSAIIQAQIDKNQGATINQITNKDMDSFIIPLPSQEIEAERIGLHIKTFDEEIAALERHLSKYNKIKTAMMQQLLTGRTRLI